MPVSTWHSPSVPEQWLSHAIIDAESQMEGERQSKVRKEETKKVYDFQAFVFLLKLHSSLCRQYNGRSQNDINIHFNLLDSFNQIFYGHKVMEKNCWA